MVAYIQLTSINLSLKIEIENGLSYQEFGLAK